MKIRHAKLMFFILILPLTLYFAFEKQPHQKPYMSKSEGQSNSPLLSIQQWKSSNGAKIFFVPVEGLAIVDIQVDFNAGSARDGSKPGLAALCLSLLNEGTTDLNADQIATIFEDNGAIYSPGVVRDRIGLSLRSLSDPTVLDPVIELFSNVIAKPSFPEKNIEAQRNETLIALKRNLQDPHKIAEEAFLKAIYQEHPYAHLVYGTEAGVNSIQKSDLQQFHQQYFVANNATITLVGNMSVQNAKNIAEKITGKLKSGHQAPLLPTVSPLIENHIHHIPYPTEQAHIMMGQPCAIENDPDFFPLLVGNNILGAPFTSRLFKEIRNKRGLVYSVYSNVLEWLRPAPFVIGLQTKNEQSAEAIKVVQETLTQFIKDGPNEDELTEVKRSIVGRFPQTVNSNANIKDIVANIAFYNLPLNYLNTYQANVNAVTREEIKNVFKRRIHPEKMALIVVAEKQP